MQQEAQHIPESKGAMLVITKILLGFPLVRILVGVLICSIGYFACAALLRPVTGLLGSEATIGRPVRATIVMVALLLIYYWLFKYYEKRKVTELSLRHLPKEGLLGVAGAIVMISGTIAILSMLGCYQVLSYEFRMTNVLAGFVVILGMVVAEEIVFRGIIYRILEEWLGTNLALIIPALLFGLVHLRNEGANLISVISAISGGIMLGLAFSLTKRLWLPIFLHTGWNFAQLFFGVTLSGLSEFSIYNALKSRLHGPEWLVGGAFGLENSIVAIAFVVLVSRGLYYLTVKKGQIVRPSWRRSKDTGGPNNDHLPEEE